MEAVFLTLLEVSAASAVVILAVVLLSSLINRRFTARWKYWLWMVLAVRLLVPFNPSFETAPARVEVSIPAAPITFPTAAAAVPAPPAQPAGPAVTIGVSEPVSAAPAMTTVELLMLLWLIGALVFLLWQTVSYLRFRGLVKRWGLPIREDSAAAAVLRQIEAEFGIGGKIPALVCKEVSSPMMIGFFRPLLILPQEDYTAQGLSYILRHELTHWHRRDIWYKALMLLANAVHWFNPAVWLMAREASRDLEISCDAAVMKNAGMEERREYSEIILSCIHREIAVKTTLSTHFYGGKKALKERFANILSTRKRRTGLIAFGLVLLCGALIGGLVACKKTDPSETRRELTREEIARVNAAFVPLVNNDTEVNPLGVYLISYYESPYQLALNEFLAYYPTDETVTDPAEFEALKALAEWPFGAEIGLDTMPVPIHRIPASAVEEKLREGFDIGLDDLSYRSSGDLMYLEGYDCFYNTTSDAVWGFFVCEEGYLEGDDTAVLTNERQRLELHRKGERWYFYSFMNAASAGAASRIPVENWSYISSFSDPLPQEYEHPQLICKDETAARLARAISPLNWFISTAEPPSFDASHPLDTELAARIAFDNTPRLDWVSFNNYPDHPIVKRIAQLREEEPVICDIIYADDAAAALKRLFGVTDWEHHTVEYYNYFPEEGVYITYAELIRGVVYPLVISWQETANGYSCEVVKVSAHSNTIDGVEVTEENAAELAARVPHFVFTFDMTSGEPVVTGFARGSLQPQPLPLSIRLHETNQDGTSLWGLFIDDPEELALVANLLSTQYLTPSSPEESSWPDGGNPIEFVIDYGDHTVTGACNPNQAIVMSHTTPNSFSLQDYTRLRTFEDGTFYNYPNTIGIQLLAFLDRQGFDVGSWWKENPDTENEPESDDQGPWENIDTSVMYSDEENAARERERNFHFEIVDAFSQGLSKESYSYYTSYGEGDGDEMQLVLEIGVTDEAAVDSFLASWTGTKWDRLVKKTGTVSQARQEEFCEKVEQLNLGPNVYLYSRPEAGNHGGENGKILVSLNLDLYAPLEEVERWREMPQAIIDFAAENGIPENMLGYMAPRYTPPGSNPDT